MDDILIIFIFIYLFHYFFCTVNGTFLFIACRIGYDLIVLDVVMDDGSTLITMLLLLLQIIHERYPEYYWVARVVETFIMLSITVSFLTMGAALQHTRIIDLFIYLCIYLFLY